MAGDDCIERPLYGGAISTVFPLRFQDISNIRPVPDHQVFADPNCDVSLIFELLDLKHDVEDNGSAIWFLGDLAAEQDAEGSLSISKGRQGREAQNIVRVYLANIRLKEVGTDVLITAYEPLLINPLSESAWTVGYGPAVPARESGCLPVADAFHFVVSNFKVHDWNLFGAAP